MDYLDEDKLREWDELSLNSRIYHEANKPGPIDRILYAAACGIKNSGNEDNCTEEAARQYGYNYSNERPGMVQPARDGFIAGATWGVEQFAKVVRVNLPEIGKDVQSQFERLYLEITGTKMYGGYND